MQVSHSTLSAALFSAIGASAAGSKRPALQYPLQPVTIEGQIVEDNKQKSKSNASVKDRDENLSLDKETQQQQSSNSPVDNSASHLLIQARLNNSIQAANSLERPEPTNSPEPLTNSPEPVTNSPEPVTNTQSGIPHVNSFPYSNRRSFNGLAGEYLVLQSYLNNEPANYLIADNRSRSIDIFI